MIFREAFHQLISGALGIEPYPTPCLKGRAAGGGLLPHPRRCKPPAPRRAGSPLQSHNWQIDLFATRRTELDELANRLSAWTAPPPISFSG